MPSHDSLFKYFLSQPDAMRDLMEIHLPPAHLQYCDLNTLTLQSGTHIEPSLRARYSDILWSVRTTDAGDGYIYALIEHQSTPDPHMPFRLLRYALDIMQRHFDQHKKLPLVIPMLFYTGEKKYPHSMCWTDHLTAPQLARQIYTDRQGFPLVDLTTIADEEIRTHRRIALLEFAQKNIARHELMDIVDTLADLLAEQLTAGYTDEDKLCAIIHYALATGDTTASDEAFLQALVKKLPKQKENIMTLAQKIENRGIAKGIEQGIARGMAQGMEQGIAHIARNLLNDGMAYHDIQRITGLSEQELIALRTDKR